MSSYCERASRILPSALLFAAIASAANVTFEADRWERSRDAIVLHDMSLVEPKASLSNVRKLRHWKVLDYETATMTGKCIASLPDTGAPAVTLPLNVKGWHAVYVGLGGNGRFGFGQENNVRLKLTRDTTYQHRGYTGAKDDIEEVYFKTADLTGQSLQIAQYRFQALMDLRPEHAPHTTVVMYIKLVPLTEAEVDWVKRDRERTDTGKLVATMDGFSWISQHYPTTKSEFLEDFECLRDTDFGTVYWQIIGTGLVNFPSKLGTIPGVHVNDFPRTGDGYVTASVKKFIAEGTDHTRMAVEAAHAMGKKILIGIRASAWQCPPEFEDYFTSDFYRDHPEWRTYDRDGTPVMRMSYAVPEVRQYILGIMREVLAYHPDGIELIYFRGLPLILWEEPFCKQFQAKYGVDAKKVPEDDPRLYELRGQIITQFMRDIRRLLDETRRAQGRKTRLELSATVVHTEEDNRKYGLDVAEWVKEGLVDRIGIFPKAFHTDTRKPIDMAWFRRITEGSRTEVYPLIIGWRLPSAKATIAEARQYFQDGAKGLIVWDPDPTSVYTAAAGYLVGGGRSYTIPQRPYWPLVTRLGHVEALEELQSADRPAPKYIPLKRYGDYWFGRWIPDVGF